MSISGTRRFQWSHLLSGFLCLIIAMQILGSPISFFDLDASADLVESTLSEGISIITRAPLVNVTSSMGFYSVITAAVQEIFLIHLPFRPPILHV